jgi:preprotein translocase subunit SecA
MRASQTAEPDRDAPDGRAAPSKPHDLPPPDGVRAGGELEAASPAIAFSARRWRAAQAQVRATAKPPLAGLDAAWHAAAGRLLHWWPRRRRFLALAQRVLDLEPVYHQHSDAALRNAAHDLRERFCRGRHGEQEELHAFAVVREGAWRTLGMRPYLVQVAGGIALHRGNIVEMATGEGKTLTATLPATLLAFRGEGCHVHTVNDYLAGRDAEEMEPLYRFFGLSVGHVSGEMAPPDRRAGYAADVTYLTNKEAAADFLRDRLAMGRVHGPTAPLVTRLSAEVAAQDDRLVMRGLPYAIVDEADSVLIDEAVTPLIISNETNDTRRDESIVTADALARQLEAGRDYVVNHRYREVTLTARGRQRIEQLTQELGSIWSGARRREELVNRALTAHLLFRRDEEYVIQPDEKKAKGNEPAPDKVIIVDGATGRLMPDRTWRDGLHEAVEAKENLPLSGAKETLARISFQRFFSMYKRLSGMTGTCYEARHELWQTYRIPTVRIPTHRPIQRVQLPGRVFADHPSKVAAVLESIQAQHAQGRPVLVGTRSVAASEEISRLLQERGLPHAVLNAVRHREEAEIVRFAGQPGRITVATNMAGRGTDIKLGKGVAQSGGLAVIASECNLSLRIDRQLFGRAGRQGDVGSAQAFFCWSDELMMRYLPRPIRAVGRWLSRLSPRPACWLAAWAQRRADRAGAEQRKGVNASDRWLDESLGFAGREHG